MHSEDDNLNSINIYAHFSYNPDCEPKTVKLKDGRNKKVSWSTAEDIAKSYTKKPISKEKYNDRIQLCTCTSQINPNDFHKEFLQIRNSTQYTQDCLQETDDEEETVSLKQD